jgi:hypothetical protein
VVQVVVVAPTVPDGIRLVLEHRDKVTPAAEAHQARAVWVAAVAAQVALDLQAMQTKLAAQVARELQAILLVVR